jgi:hypothetical protein
MSWREALAGISRNFERFTGWLWRRKWYLLGALVVVGAAVLFYPLVVTYFAWRTIRSVSDLLASQSGLSPNLVKGLVILATIPFFCAVAIYMRGIFKLRGGKRTLRLYSNRYGIIIVVYIAAFFLAQYFASRHAYYSKWCADTPEGIETFDIYGTGHDPIYGIALQPCTVAQIAALRRQQVPLETPNRMEISDPEHFSFFDPISGAPRVWYYKSADGTYRLYDHPGKDSATGAALRPIDDGTRNALIRLEHQKQQRAAQVTAAQLEARRTSFLDHYINGEAAAPTSTKTAAVLVFENNGQELSEVDNYLLSRVSQYGAAPVRSLFKPAFLSEGRAAALFRGDWSQVQQLALARRVKYLLLGNAGVSYTENRGLGGVRTADFELHLKALDVPANAVVDDATIDVAGAGFTNDAALDNAIAHAEPQLAAFAKSVLENR